jgi:hypothetical protein
VFVGIIKNKDILLNPRSIIHMRGWKGYFKLVWRTLSRKPYAFIRMTQDSQWFFDQSVTNKPKRKPRHPAT